MEQVINILKQIKQTSSRNEKENILRQNYNNIELKQILEYTYNPFKIYSIGKKAFKKTNQQNKFNNIIKLLDYLLKHNTGTNKDKVLTNAFIQEQPKEYQEWYKKIILKDLGIGITAKTINKIYPGLIPIFECMLASPYKDKHPQHVIIEPKLDGIRCLCIEGKLFTRNGKQLEGFVKIEEQMSLFPKNIVFDGELMAENFTTTQELTFKKSKNKTGVNYYIFDCLPLDEFKNGKSKEGLTSRKQFLQEIFNNISTVKNIKLVPIIYKGKFIDDIINEEHVKMVEQGYEGIMIKDINSLYECKRTKTWLKKKDFDMYDLEVKDIFEGQDKYRNMLGGVIVDYKGFNLEIGSGFTDEERIKFWNNPNLIIGKTILVQAQEESKNKQGGKSLRFPIFKGIRYDK